MWETPVFLRAYVLALAKQFGIELSRTRITLKSGREMLYRNMIVYIFRICKPLKNMRFFKTFNAILPVDFDNDYGG